MIRGIGRVVMARRERVMMLEPFGKGIMGTTLHYPNKIRSDEAVFEEIPEMKLPDQMVGLAEEIIDRMSGQFEPDKIEDRYENAMIELIRSKQAGLPAPTEKAPSRPANVVNLTDALRRSIEDSSGKSKPAKTPAKRAAEPKKARQESRITEIPAHTFSVSSDQASMAVCRRFRDLWMRSTVL